MYQQVREDSQMIRSLEKCPEAPSGADPWVGYEKMELNVRVVTPMFGGGVEPGAPDSVTPIRVPSIRGHLRFWWRATRGAAFATVEELRRREVEVWGDTENPSKVIIATTVNSPSRLPQGKSFPRFEKDHPGYALFPFQGNVRKNEPIGKGTYGVKFRVNGTFPSYLANDVNAALWAWLNFGGLGARTRRGCGALHCKEFAPSGAAQDAIRNWIAVWWRKLALSDSKIQRDWPVLRPSVFVPKEPLDKPLMAWNRVVDLLHQFRQGKNIGRNPGQDNRPGRSRWPEPEAVRRATGGSRAKMHQRLGHIPDNVYPRAEFGLPIIFHFKDQNAGDPYDTSLEPTGGTDRF
jgi:CRISPR-associated protein Cmr1